MKVRSHAIRLFGVPQRWTRRGTAAAAAICLALAAPARAEERRAVRLDVGERELRLGNGLVELRLGLDGRLRGLARAGGVEMLGDAGGYWQANSSVLADGQQPRQQFVSLGGPHRVVRKTGECVEVAFVQRPVEHFPFRGGLHYVLRRGESGFYVYMTAEHDANMPAGFLEQYAYNLRLSGERFDYIAADETRRGPSHSCREEARATRIMDATFRLAEGRVVSKYDYCHDLADDDYHAYGWAGAEAGVWLIQASGEYYPAGPFKQFLTAHQTARSPIILWQPHCIHFGSGRVICRAGETWRKLYGPAFVYVNGGSDRAAAWADARRQAPALRGQWPYPWMAHELFAGQRGRLTGRIVFAEGRAAANAWVILSPPGVDCSQEVKGYHFWGRTDERGGFAIGGVRPGTYDLTAAGADQFEQFAAGPVAVEAGKVLEVGVLTWRPTSYGRRVWQIGTADRSPGEFRNGDDYRHWGLWRRYPVQFPRGVQFRVGTSRQRDDWNFAHWSWHTGRPDWRIEFELGAAPAGRALLTIGIAAARPPGRARTTDVRVGVNGREIGAIRLAFTGGCGYRSGRQTTPYSVVRLPFDAGLLTKGLNTVSLEHAGSTAYRQGDAMGETGSGPGYLMYDAIRLEVDADNPARAR